MLSLPIQTVFKSGGGSMTTTTSSCSANSQAIIEVAGPSEQPSLTTHFAGRLIQITLALYLLPALLIVLLVGGAGILAVLVSRLFTSR